MWIPKIQITTHSKYRYLHLDTIQIPYYVLNWKLHRCQDTLWGNLVLYHGWDASLPCYKTPLSRNQITHNASLTTAWNNYSFVFTLVVLKTSLIFADARLRSLRHLHSETVSGSFNQIAWNPFINFSKNKLLQTFTNLIIMLGQKNRKIAPALLDLPNCQTRTKISSILVLENLFHNSLPCLPLQIQT